MAMQRPAPAKTMSHDAGAYARCSCCLRYSNDPATLGDRPPTCECGDKHGWSGSFVSPGPDAKWSDLPPLDWPHRECVSMGPPSVDVGETSDGYHTFNELYEHRFVLWLALCRAVGGSWRTRLHSDGTFYEGWFVLGLGVAQGEQITYHLPLRLWDEAGFAETIERVRNFDGHTSTQVVERIRQRFVVGPPATPREHGDGREGRDGR